MVTNGAITDVVKNIELTSEKDNAMYSVSHVVEKNVCLYRIFTSS